MGPIGRMLRVQPGEGRTAGLIVALMAVAFAGSTIGESGTSALFFDRIGTDALPTMFLVQGVVGLGATVALTRALARADRHRVYVLEPLGLAVVVLFERGVVELNPSWIYPVLWLTVPIAALLQAVNVWGTAGLVTDTRGAKRLFPLFGAGAILGAVVGGLGTRPLAQAIGAQNLLVVWAAALAGSAWLCRIVIGTARPRVGRGRTARSRIARGPSTLSELRQSLSFVRRSSLLRWMTTAAVLFSVLFFSLYLPFAQASTLRFGNADDLAGFLGSFWASVTAVALVISLLLTNRLLGLFGAAAMVLVLPFLYAGSFAILIASGGFTAIVALRFIVVAWTQGVASPAWETLVNVVPDSRRDQTRAFLNGGPTQVGTAIAGLTQLVGQQALSSSQLSLIGLTAAVLTILVAWMIRGSYVSALVDALRAGRPSVFERPAIAGTPILPETDGRAIEIALDAARDSDPRMRRLAVEMLAEVEDRRVRGILVEAVDDGDPLVRANAVKGLARHAGPESAHLLQRALLDPDAGVRLAAVANMSQKGGDVTPSLLPLINDPDPTVAAASSVALLRSTARLQSIARLRSLISDVDPRVRVSVVDRLRRASADDVEILASPALSDPAPAVRAAALAALATVGSPAVFEPALEGLGADDQIVRAAALDSLFALGPAEHEERLREYADLRAELALDDAAKVAVIPTDGAATELLRDALLERGRRRALVALTALGLLTEDRDATRGALDNLNATDPRLLANALETLEVTAGSSLVRDLLTLWERPTGAASAGEDWLNRVLDDEDPFIRSCARLVQASQEKGAQMARSKPSLSALERILVLRKVPLFSALSPTDLARVADVCQECTYADSDVIVTEDEIGDELHIVVDGSVRVVRDNAGAGDLLAMRGPGEVVGEMSIITRAPRVASLIAEGDVRTVMIGRLEFESIISERPEVAMAVMRVLAERLGDEAAARTGPG
jgi:HEAT repeat protein